VRYNSLFISLPLFIEGNKATVAHRDKTLPQMTKHLLGWKTLARKNKTKTIAGMENTCAGDKTLTQIENNSTNTNTFTNHHTFSKNTKHPHKSQNTCTT